MRTNVIHRALTHPLARKSAHHAHHVFIGAFYVSVGATIVGLAYHVEVHHADVWALASDALARIAHLVAPGD